MRLACVFAVIVSIAPVACASVEEDLATIYAASAAQPILTHRGELAQRIEPLLLKQCAYLCGLLKPWQDDPKALLLFKGTSGEMDIRSAGHLAYGLATIDRTISADVAGGISRAEARDRAIAILRFVLPTHGAGDKRCTDGKQWHNQWQSAMWAHCIAKAAWLLWDDLDPNLRWLAARMICDEADRFVGVTPPAQVENDTKAEENAWNSQIISLACNMFPRHPHHEQWRETAIRWVICSYPTAADVRSTKVIDGKPMNQWLTGPNIHDDYTLENHNRVHPDYMTTVHLVLSQTLSYQWGGNRPPDALRFNAEKIYANLKKLALPDGSWLYPNGQDWWLHRQNDWLDMNAIMAAMFEDPQAARLALMCVETAEKMSARHADGSLFESDEVTVPTGYAIPAELFADPYLLLRAFGERSQAVSEQELFRHLIGIHVFDAGKFALVRSDHSIASFSWGEQVMGMVLPLQKDLLLTPNERSLIGIVAAKGIARERPAVKEIRRCDVADGFAVCALLERGGGALEQRLAFVALPDGRTVYAENVLRAAPQPEITQLDLCTLGVLNEPNWVYHQPPRRAISYLDNDEKIVRVEFAPRPPENEAYYTFGDSTLNLDDCLGMVRPLVYGGGAQYLATPTPARGRTEQMLTLCTVHPGWANKCKPGESIARNVIIFYPGQSAKQTMGTRCDAEEADGGKRVLLTLEDNKRLSIDYEKLTVSMKQEQK
jgi:hypothetical protein